MWPPNFHLILNFNLCELYLTKCLVVRPFLVTLSKWSKDLNSGRYKGPQLGLIPAIKSIGIQETSQGSLRPNIIEVNGQNYRWDVLQFQCCSNLDFVLQTKSSVLGFGICACSLFVFVGLCQLEDTVATYHTRARGCWQKWQPETPSVQCSVAHGLMCRANTCSSCTTQHLQLMQHTPLVAHTTHAKSSPGSQTLVCNVTKVTLRYIFFYQA